MALPATRCDDEVDPARLCDLYRGLDEVPESAADEVVTALRASTIKGRKPTVRRERYEAR
jgi:ATP-dependent RNA helicase DeaD